jgi:hypothetical protein
MEITPAEPLGFGALRKAEANKKNPKVAQKYSRQCFILQKRPVWTL